MNPSIFQQGMQNQSFWSGVKDRLGQGATAGANQASRSSNSGMGSTIGSIGGGAIGTAIGGPVGGVIGSAIGGTGGSMLESGLMGGDEQSGADKLAEEQAQSELETRRWEERNAAPTAGIGQYLMRATVLQGYPVLGALNNIDFLYNKVLPYVRSYGIGKTDRRGNPKR